MSEVEQSDGSWTEHRLREALRRAWGRCRGWTDRERAYVRFTSGVVLEGFELRGATADG